MKQISIQTTSPTPIYQQIYDQISSQILNGDLKPDSALPSIRGMAKELRVSIITIKKTWEILERNDFIYTLSGKGSYVQKNTKHKLESKKIDTIKKSLQQSINLSHKMDISKKQLLDILAKLYDMSSE